MDEELKCECGGNPFVDYWNNWRTKTVEIFVRCPNCGRLGEVKKNEEDAIVAWNETMNNHLLKD